jgi:hypothetical protein
MDETDGPLVFAQACKMGKSKGLFQAEEFALQFWGSPHWLKSKNPNASAVKRKPRRIWGCPWRA